MLFTAGLFYLAVATVSACWPHLWFDWADLERPRLLILWRGVGLLSAAFGLCFLIDFALESVSYNITTSSYDLIRYQTLEKGAEETQDFVDEFERLTTYQRNLGLIKDSVREQQLDYKRAIKAGLAPEELREEMRMNQMIERNLGGIKGLF